MIYLTFKIESYLLQKNSIVDQINDYMLDLIPSEEKTYISYDTPLTHNPNGDAIGDVHTPEFLNTINAYGLSQDKIKGWSVSDVLEEY